MIHGDIAFKRIGGECHSKCSLGANLVIDNCLCSFRHCTSASNFKAIGQLIMEILYFKVLGLTECCLTVNAVVLVLGEYQI